MPYPIPPPIQPMLARVAEKIPTGPEWLYEPKWDGFRAIVFRDGDKVHIGSRNQRPLERYFPEIVDIALEAFPERCVVDGEIVIEGEAGLDFDALLQRIHPAASRVRLLAQETPGTYIGFDLLAEETDLRTRPLGERRERLVKAIRDHPTALVTPQTSDPDEAGRWFDQFEGAGLDGVVAKRTDGPYVEGERVMIKVKHERTAECVVGGYRLAKNGLGVGSLLLGVYDGDGVLHHVGHTSTFSAALKQSLLAEFRKLEGEGSFGSGRTPGGPSRWSGGRETEWIPVKPVLVCEVSFDHLQGDRFRHGTRFLRWRPDKAPEECTFDQLAPPNPFSIAEIRKLSRRG